MEIMVDILQAAIEIEMKSAELYNELSRQTPFNELVGIFKFLSEQEMAHYRLLKSWQDGGAEPAPESKPFLADIDKIFNRFSDQLKQSAASMLHYYQVYEKAFAFELETLAFYRQMSRNADEGRKATIVKIMEQEAKHAEFIKNLMAFLRHPGEWLENAEWRHSEPY